MMNPFSWLQMTNMISYQGLVRTFPREKISPIQHGGDGKTLRLHKNHPGWLKKGADFITT
ncbi:hypothetical protein [Aeromonas veronii]|uniref:hypothetical protein n=1 Tax=Aeromonas veronii TaxID=654 RepID=UPI00160175CD|nr:hypothetical protein [Aeromonas veronii]